MTTTSLINAISSGDWFKAERLLRREAAKRSAPAEIHYNLGKVLLEQGNAKSAIPSLRKAVSRKAGYQSAWFELGRAAVLVRDYALAEKSFARAAALDPTDADARLNLARVAVRRGSWRAALTASSDLGGPEVAALRYRALAELRSPAASSELSAMLEDAAMKPFAIRAMTRTSKGSIPLSWSPGV